MRSVYVFTPATEDQLRAHFDALASRTGNTEQWIYPSARKRVLYIEPTNSLLEELDPETLKNLGDLFGGSRIQCVCIDASGHSSGEHEIKNVTLDLLGRFGGVAMDDHTDHFWSADEIAHNGEYQGKKFFLG